MFGHWSPAQLLPAFLQPYVLVLEEYLVEIFEHFNNHWMSWLFTPILISVLIPLLFIVLLYGSVIWLHIFKLRHEIGQAFSRDPWEGGRSALAAFWLAHGRIWHGYEVEGLENIPSTGPALLVYYHGALPVDVYYLLAKCILFKQRVIHCVGFRLMMDVFFVTPGSLESCVNELRNGNILCISPANHSDVYGEYTRSIQIPVLWQITILGKPLMYPHYHQQSDDLSVIRTERKQLKSTMENGHTNNDDRGSHDSDNDESSLPADSDEEGNDEITPEELRLVCIQTIQSMIQTYQTRPGSIIRGLVDRVPGCRKYLMNSPCFQQHLIENHSDQQSSVSLPSSSSTTFHHTDLSSPSPPSSASSQSQPPAFPPPPPPPPPSTATAEGEVECEIVSKNTSQNLVVNPVKM